MATNEGSGSVCDGTERVGLSTASGSDRWRRTWVHVLRPRPVATARGTESDSVDCKLTHYPNENSNRVLSRRATLRLMGAAGATAFVGWQGGWSAIFRMGGSAGTVSAQGPSCVAKPELTEGPYFVDERLNRSDIRSDPMTGAVRQGVPLRLAFNVSRLEDGVCTPLPGAYVDVWHADALGTYSDVGSESGEKYLRGYQMTDEDGLARFTTIYPGWYPGRTVHIHFKIRTFSGAEEAYDFTSQLFFEDALSNQVFTTKAPYSRNGSADTTNARDGIYRSGGAQLLLALTPDGDGYAATFDIGLVGVPQSGGGGGTPAITGALVKRKKLVVTGSDFAAGAVVLLDGEAQETRNNASTPSTTLVAKRSGRQIARGETVALEVQNPDGSRSDAYSYTRPQ